MAGCVLVRAVVEVVRQSVRIVILIAARAVVRIRVARVAERIAVDVGLVSFAVTGQL